MPIDSGDRFGDVIVKARKAKGWSLRELAARLDKQESPASPQYLNDIEHHRRVPAEGVIKGLAKALGFDEDGTDVLFHLAGKLPPDLAAKGDPDKLAAAYRAFRRKAS